MQKISELVPLIAILLCYYQSSEPRILICQPAPPKSMPVHWEGKK